MEQVAKSKELGIWSKSLRLITDNSNTTRLSEAKYSFLERITVEMTNAVDGRNFHVRVLDKNAHYLKIEKALQNFDANKAEELQKPILKGTLCAAKYKADNKWYRARVLGTVAKGQIEVLFIDYGNTDVINSEDSRALRKLPANLLQYEPQAKKCSLAYVKVPRLAREQGANALKFIKKNALDQVHDALVCDERGNSLKLIMVDENEHDWSESLNAYMLAQGIAILDQDAMQDSSTPEEVFAWQMFEDEARDKLLGLWQNEGNAIVSDDSFDEAY